MQILVHKNEQVLQCFAVFTDRLVVCDPFITLQPDQWHPAGARERDRHFRLAGSCWALLEDWAFEKVREAYGGSDCVAYGVTHPFQGTFDSFWRSEHIAMAVL